MGLVIALISNVLLAIDSLVCSNSLLCNCISVPLVLIHF